MLRSLRGARTGEKVTEQYQTSGGDGFRLEPAPATPPALALAALRPQMIRLAAAEADAAITNWLAARDVPTVRAVAGPGCELVARIFVCPTPDAAVARAIGRRMIAAYMTVPAYAAFHAWLGRGEAMRAMQEGWASRTCGLWSPRARRSSSATCSTPGGRPWPTSSASKPAGTCTTT